MERKGTTCGLGGDFVRLVHKGRPLRSAGVRALLPDHDADAGLDLAERYANDPRPVPEDRPWVLVNMVSSADGAASLDGTSGALGGDGDRRAFSAIRALPDLVLVAAGTVRAERYRPLRVADDQVERRLARGQAPVPLVCIVSRALDLDPTPGSVLRPDDDRPRPLVATTARADPDRRRRLEQVAEVLAVGEEHVELGVLLGRLRRERDVGVVLCEGGPSLIGQLLAEDLVDELCLTLSPLAAGGDASRIARSHDPSLARALVLDRVLEQDGQLLLRYHRDR